MGGGITIYPAKKLLDLAFDRVIVGTFTGYYEIRGQLEQMGIEKNKIDVSHIELSVRAREAFLSDFATESTLSGSVAELGVYRGDFARRINEAFSDRKLYLFDTFEGFVESDLKDEMSKSLGKRHFANTSIDLVLSKMPYPQNCVIKKGWFPQSASDDEILEKEQFCFVNLDADLYEPILSGLKFFYPKMVSGGVILIHEYFSNGYVGVRKAVSEFMEDFNLKSYQKFPIGDNLSIAIVKI